MREPSEARFLEDFSVGDRFQTGTMTVSEEAVVSFAEQFDPQVFHLDREAAARSFFGELVASGWVTPDIEYPSYRAFWRSVSSGGGTSEQADNVSFLAF